MTASEACDGKAAARTSAPIGGNRTHGHIRDKTILSRVLLASKNENDLAVGQAPWVPSRCFDDRGSGRVRIR